MTNEYIEISNNEIIIRPLDAEQDITELYDRLHALEAKANTVFFYLDPNVTREKTHD